MIKTPHVQIAVFALLAMVAVGADARDHSAENAAHCRPPFRVGYRIAHFGDVTAAIWYPTSANEGVHSYTRGFTGAAARGGEPLRTCGPFPLVVFSHGLGGCGIQSIFFTETLARQGYVVVAPDHRDALCSVDGRKPAPFDWWQQAPLIDAAAWSHDSFVDRRNDIEKVLNAMLGEGPWKGVAGADQVGVVGHSLGGYAALGVVGGWNDWKDARIRAALLFSPYSLPFSIHNTLPAIRVPLMYQGADFDLGITPFIEGSTGAYARSNAPKYFVKLRGGNHFIWTNLQCAGQTSVASCIRTRPEARLINAYGVAFLDYYLKGKPHPSLWATNPALSKYEFER